jgi:transcriptional regulator with XRE-family HTH domain
METVSTDVSVMIFNMDKKLAPVEFVEKIKAKMAEQNLGVRDLARKLGVSHPTVTELVTYGKKPSLDTCLAISRWLGQSEVVILRESGLISPGQEDEAKFEDWKYLLEGLNERDLNLLRDLAEKMAAENEKERALKSLDPGRVANG